MSIRICSYHLVKRLKYKRIVVAVSNLVRNDPSVVQIKYCTQIDFFNLYINVVFELRCVGQPFFVWLVRMKISVQNVFCGYFRY